MMKTKHRFLTTFCILLFAFCIFCTFGAVATSAEEPTTPVAEFVGKQVNLGGDISMKFYVRNNEDRPIESITVEVEFLGKLTYLTECEPHPTEDKVYIYTFEGINPQCLGDLMNVTILWGGVPVGHEKAMLTGYSVKENLINAYTKTDDANMKQLIIDTLEYGAAAQVYRNYKTDALVTKDVAFLSEGKTEVDVPRSSPVVNETVADSIKEATVNFSATNFIKVSYNDGEIKTLTSDAVAAYDFAKKMQFSADGLFTLGYSVNDYCYDVINSETTSEAMKSLVLILHAPEPSRSSLEPFPSSFTTEAPEHSTFPSRISPLFVNLLAPEHSMSHCAIFPLLMNELAPLILHSSSCADRFRLPFDAPLNSTSRLFVTVPETEALLAPEQIRSRFRHCSLRSETMAATLAATRTSSPVKSPSKNTPAPPPVVIISSTLSISR